MFTTGSKFFTGATAVAFASWVIVCATTGGAVGWTAVIGLISLTVAFGFLAGINFFIKDGNVKSMDTAAAAEAGAGRPPAPASMWPAVGALGAAVTALGAHTYPIVFKGGIVIMLAALVEWLVQAWSERASDDPAYNASLRKRLLHPLEFPVAAAVGLGVIIYSFSRIMLAVDKMGGRAAFGLIAVAVLAGGTIVAMVPGLRRQVVAGVATIGAVGLVSAGAVAAVSGEKPIEAYPTVLEEEFAYLCDEPGEVEGESELAEHAREIDERASQSVSATSSIYGTVVLTEDGELQAYRVDALSNGFQIPRANTVNVLVKNRSDEEHRFTVRLGTFAPASGETGGNVAHVFCTPLIEPGGEALMTLRFDQSDARNLDEEGYRIEVPGIEGQKIQVVVP